MLLRRLSLAGLVLGLAPVSAHAQENVAIGAGVGTTGAHVEGQLRVSDHFVFRGGYEALLVEHDQVLDDIRYSGEIDSAVFSVFWQYHPMANPLFVTGGALLGDRSLAMGAEPVAPVTVGDMTFTPSQIGRLEGRADLGDVAPVLAAGWDDTFYGTGLGFRLMAGVAVGKEPDVALASVGGSLSSDPTLQAELREEELRLEEETRDLRYYPVLQLALTYRF